MMDAAAARLAEADARLVKGLAVANVNGAHADQALHARADPLPGWAGRAASEVEAPRRHVSALGNAVVWLADAVATPRLSPNGRAPAPHWTSAVRDTVRPLLERRAGQGGVAGRDAPADLTPNRPRFTSPPPGLADCPEKGHNRDSYLA